MLNKQEIEGYNNYVKAKQPITKPFPTLIWAFLVGGAICVLGQAIYDIIMSSCPELTKDAIQAYTLVALIFLSTLFTGIGLYDKIGAFAGAGSIIPITGFANSIASPAMEFKSEGWIFGMCAKMFVVAGPVLVNGIAGSVIVGLIYLFF